MSDNPKNSVSQYFRKYDTFFIPSYQRSYKWGFPRGANQSDTEVLLFDLLEAYKAEKEEYFIQGITGFVDSRGRLVLIDGQQRTVTFFLIISEAKRRFPESPDFARLVYEDKILYDVRDSTKNFLDRIAKGDFPTQNELYKTQEGACVYLSLESIIGFLDKLGTDAQAYIKYVLDHTKLFSITVAKESAEKTFSLMNGAKAVMQTDELVKADFLSKASQDTNGTASSMMTLDDIFINVREQIASNWENTNLRSRMARQWDKWLYWWHRDEVRKYFKMTESLPMGWLLPLFCRRVGSDYIVSDESSRDSLKRFQNEFLKGRDDAKQNFERLRRLQKGFEDIYADNTLHNYTGYAIAVTDKRHTLEILDFVINHRKNLGVIRQMALKVMMFGRISKVEIDEEACKDFKDRIFDNFAYQEYSQDLYRWLFFRNVDGIISNGARFEFLYYDKKSKKLQEMYSAHSIEHIWPKSRVIFTVNNEEHIGEDDGSGSMKLPPDGELRIKRSEVGDFTEHSIGNLAFLHKGDNSVFNKKTPKKKKEILFNIFNEKQIFSRVLPHTIDAFGIWDTNEDGDITTTFIKNVELRRSQEVEAFEAMFEDK